MLREGKWFDQGYQVKLWKQWNQKPGFFTPSPELVFLEHEIFKFRSASDSPREVIKFHIAKPYTNDPESVIWKGV